MHTGLRLLELTNIERLLTMPNMPPITNEHKARIIKNLEKVEVEDRIEEMRKNIAIGSMKAIITVEEKENMHPLEFNLRKLNVWDLFLLEFQEETQFDCIEDYEQTVVDKITLPSQCILFDGDAFDEEFWYNIEREVRKLNRV